MLAGLLLGARLSDLCGRLPDFVSVLADLNDFSGSQGRNSVLRPIPSGHATGKHRCTNDERTPHWFAPQTALAACPQVYTAALPLSPSLRRIPETTTRAADREKQLRNRSLRMNLLLRA